jgi:hypothetical protein
MATHNLMPDRLGPYRLLERIGEGGMGVVHLATDPDGRKVAIKILRPGVAADPDARLRLGREFETMRRVRSSFVAEVIDADVTGDMPYVVTRYVAGPSLDRLIASDGPLRGQALERLAWGLAEGLAAVHAAGVVHRDLKPGNVVMSGGVPVLIDFGIAQAPDATRITQTGMFMGTPGYLAPEVVEGQPAGPAADVHSWASTVAFAATGRAPFGTGSYETIFYRILGGRADLDGLPRPLLPLVTAALGRDPAARPTAVALSTACAAIDLSAYQESPGAGATAVQPAAIAPFGAQGRPPAVPAPPAGPVTLEGPVPLDGPVLPARAPAPPGGAPAAQVTGSPDAGTGPRSGLRRVLGAVMLVTAVAAGVVLPVVAAAGSFALIVALRATDSTSDWLARRRSERGRRVGDVPVMLLTTPWALLRGTLTSVLLLPLALVCATIAGAATIIAIRAHPLPSAAGYAAAVFVAFYCFGPGSGKPRNRLGSMLVPVTRTPISATATAIVIGGMALAAIAAAVTSPHVFWPLPPTLAWHLPAPRHWLTTVQFHLQHL